MGMQLPNSSSSSKFARSSLAEINVTPLVDVMLVLLIVFMISAPLMQQGTTVDLPKASTGALPDIDDQIVLDVDSKKQITLNGEKIKKGTLRQRLRGLSAANPAVQVFVRADRTIEYGYIALVIAEIKKAKIARVGLVTLPGEGNTKL